MTEFQPPYFPPPFPSTLASAQPPVDLFQPLTASTDPYQTFHQPHPASAAQFSYPDALRRDYHAPGGQGRSEAGDTSLSSPHSTDSSFEDSGAVRDSSSFHVKKAGEIPSQNVQIEKQAF